MGDVNRVVDAEPYDDDDAHADDGVDGEAPEVGDALEEERPSNSLRPNPGLKKVISKEKV